ncbi:hypothetical protein LMG8520_2100 [Lactococcus lactis subsp. lactis]|uniref:Lipoprotein n=2 Tax=Lactococcus lactis TaxID=1358 RepID=A0A5M9PUC0_LACLH|nr:hypothetical protein [Lactococcus lactis]KAA8699954.1 hypothetical protein F4V48_11080 [Lactococcus lactis subsp. hordniae]KSU06398.1 hypothetical protein LMG8520_2100 [Lactococcus lactis subsp. lactis]MCT3134443.1 hypothetical protein [Lactococcus lactis]
MKLKKVGIALCLSASLLVLGACSTQKSVIKDVKVDFSGYNHEGKAKLSGKYYDEITEVMKKKEGMSASDILVKIDKSSGLSNGDKVKVSILSKLKKSPIKPESKTFTVSGLKKTTSYTIDDVLKQNSVKFVGFNHYGGVKDDYVFTVDSQKNSLSNGDKISVELDSDYISGQAEKGKVLKGSKTKNIEVSGLEETGNNNKLDSVLSEIDSEARDDYKSGNTTRQESYVLVGDQYHPEAVDEFSIFGVYKVNENDSIRYRIYGYSSLYLKNGKIDMSQSVFEKNFGYVGSTKYYDNSQEAVDHLKASNLQIIKIK